MVNRFGSEDQQQPQDDIKEEETVVQEKEEPEETQVSHRVVNFNYLDLFFFFFAEPERNRGKTST